MCMSASDLFARLRKFGIKPSEHVYTSLVTMLSKLTAKTSGPSQAAIRNKLYDLLTQMQHTMFEIGERTKIALHDWFNRFVSRSE